MKPALNSSVPAVQLGQPSSQEGSNRPGHCHRRARVHPGGVPRYRPHGPHRAHVEVTDAIHRLAEGVFAPHWLDDHASKGQG